MLANIKYTFIVHKVFGVFDLNFKIDINSFDVPQAYNSEVYVDKPLDKKIIDI